MSNRFPKPARRREQVLKTEEPGKKGVSAARNSREKGQSTPSGSGNDFRPPLKSDRSNKQGGKKIAGDDHADYSVQGMSSHNSDSELAPLLPGIKPVLELLQATPERVDAVFLRKGRHGKEMESIVDLCRRCGVRFSLLDPGSFSRVYSGNSQGVVARLFEAGFVEVDDLLNKVMDAPLPLVLVLDQVQDPGNAGALARTLYALGGAGMVAPRHNGVYLGAAAAKAAAGALERLPVSKVANLGQAIDAAKKTGFTVYGAAGAPAIEKVPAAGTSHTALPFLPVLNAFTAEFRLPALLILGSEESGIRPSVEKRCDFLISIPMLRDFDSLNVAQAGGIIISAFARSILSKREK